MKNQIPKILLYSRLVFFFIIIGITFLKISNSEIIILILIYAGIIADIFDGIIARRLNISTESFRLLDTIFDLLFYFSILFYIFSINREAVIENRKLIICILSLEAMMYLISWIRFRKLPSPHAILSKFWGLYLIIEFTLLILHIGGIHFTVALIIGLIAHIDRVLIYTLLKKWDHDIPSSYHALLLRQGKEIKRRKLFNG